MVISSSFDFYVTIEDLLHKDHLERPKLHEVHLVPLHTSKIEKCSSLKKGKQKEHEIKQHSRHPIGSIIQLHQYYGLLYQGTLFYSHKNLMTVFIFHFILFTNSLPQDSLLNEDICQSTMIKQYQNKMLCWLAISACC